MAMFWVILLTYCFVSEVREGSGKNTFFLKVFAVTVCGAMTHYYFIVYAALISLTYAIWLLFNHRYSSVFRFCGAMTVAGIVLYFIFPAMIQHIFFGPRGRQVMRNAITASNFISRIESFWDIINNQLFGNWGSVLVWGMLLLAIIFIGKYCFGERRKHFKMLSNISYGIRPNFSTSYLLLIVPTVAYFVIVAKITAYRIDRYMVPVYPNIILMVCLLLIIVFERFTISKNGKIVLLCITLSMITVKSWFTVGWPYLYLNSKPYLEKVTKYAAVDNVCLHTGGWLICSMFTETKAYRSIQLCDLRNEALKQKILKRVSEENPEKLVVSLIGVNEKKHAGHLQMFLTQSKSLNYCKKLGSSYYGASYLLSCNKEP